MNRRHFIASSTLAIPMVALGSIIPSEPVVDANFIVDRILPIMCKKHTGIVCECISSYTNTPIPFDMHVYHVLFINFESIDMIRNRLSILETSNDFRYWTAIEGFDFYWNMVEKVYFGNKIPAQHGDGEIGVESDDLHRYTLKEWLKLNSYE